MSSTKLKDFDKKKMLGKGSMGTVYHVKRLSDKKSYAMKEVSMVNCNVKEREDALNEVRLLSSITHPQIVKYYESFVENNKLYIITELVRDGDLFQKLQRNQKRRENLPEETVWSIVLQVGEALKCLHEHKIIHRDVKSANIFFEGSRAKLGDLGVSTVLKQRKTSTCVGTPYYLAPEVWRNKPYDTKVDVWSLGVLLYELCVLEPPFQAKTMNDLGKVVCKGKYPRLNNSWSGEISSLMKTLLTLDASKRPTMAQVLDMAPLQARRHYLSSGCDSWEKNGDVVRTIRVPNGGVHQLQGKLPKPAYTPEKVNLPDIVQRNLRDEGQRRPLADVGNGRDARGTHPAPKRSNSTAHSRDRRDSGHGRAAKAPSEPRGRENFRRNRY